VFAIVQNDQDAPVLQVLHHRRDHVRRIPADAQTGGHEVGHERGVVGRGQIHEVNPVGECVMSRVGDRDGEAALPHAAGADKSHESGEVERSGHTLDIALPANERGGRGQTTRHRLIVAVGGEGRRVDAFGLDTPYELVSVSDNCRNVGCLRKSVFQGPAQTADVDLQIALIHEYVRPSEFDQGILTDFLSRAHHQQVQNIQRPATQLHRPVVAQEQLLARNQPERPEHKRNLDCRGNSHRPHFS
jgi:hypothetical protein